MPYQFSYTPDASKWRYDDNGFMRTNARFMKVGTMNYLGEELGEYLPQGMDPDTLFTIMVEPDTLFDPAAVKSLEGLPVVSYAHQWADLEGGYKQVGSIAGTPRQNGEFLEGELVITCPETIASIERGELADISSAYQALYEMEKGRYDGNPYDGLQRSIRYNHVALLPPGEGRAGIDVRVLNNKPQSEEVKVDLIKVQIGNQTFDVAAGQADSLLAAFNAVQNSTPETIKVQNQELSASDIESTLENIETLNSQITELEAKLSEEQGKVAALKEKLDAAMAPEAQEAAVNEMMEEREEATEILAANMDYDKEMAQNSIKGLTGHKLRAEVVSRVRAANKLPELAKEDLDNEGLVNGYYNVYKETHSVNSGDSGKKVAGHAIVQNKGGNGGERSAVSKLGYPKPAA